MLVEGICEIKEKKRAETGEEKCVVCAISDALKRTTLVGLLVQGVATSIDALSVGLQIADYVFLEVFKFNGHK